MKHRWIITLLSCGLLLGALRAEDEVGQKVPTDQTAQIPKTSPVCVRLPSLSRFDAIAKQFLPMMELFGDPGIKQMVGAGASNAALVSLGLDPASFDRTAPIYMGLSHEGEKPFIILKPAAENGITGEKELPEGMKLVVSGGLVHVGMPDAITGERRGTATKMLKGDFAAHVYVGELTTRYKEDIEQGLGMFQAMFDMQLAGGQIPMKIESEPIVGAARGVVYGIDSVAYSLTFGEDRVTTEGMIMTKAESGLRKFLARAGAPRENSLADYLPAEALITMDYSAASDWPGAEIAEFAKGTVGKETGDAIAQMIAMSKPLWGALTGRSAMSLTMQGMMGYNLHSIYELKEGADINTMIDKFDVAALNKAAKELGMPIEYKLEKNIGKHGETSLHKMSASSEAPELQMALMMATYYIAAEGRNLYMVMSMNAELEIKDLIDRVRKGEAKPGAHSKAMDRLGRARNMGFTLNFGALKAMAMMAAMIDPQAGQMMGALPDEMYMSTALAVHDGDIHWKGDIPLKQILKVAADIKAMQGGGEGGAEGTSEFD